MSKLRPEKDDIWISNDTREKVHIFKIIKHPLFLKNLKPQYSYNCHFFNIENVSYEMELSDFKRLYSYYGKSGFSFKDLFKSSNKNKMKRVR